VKPLGHNQIAASAYRALRGHPAQIPFDTPGQGPRTGYVPDSNGSLRHDAKKGGDGHDLKDMSVIRSGRS